MTINELQTVIDLIEECRFRYDKVATVWEYTNAYNQETMFAVFTIVCINDLNVSPAVQSPVLIYDDGEWFGKYKYLNG